MKMLTFDTSDAKRLILVNLYCAVVAVGAAVGVLAAGIIAVTSSARHPPRYRFIFPFWGFFVAMTIVFAATDEVVCVPLWDCNTIQRLQV